MKRAKAIAADVWSCAVHAARAMRADKKNSLLCMIADILFFIFAGFINSAYMTRMVASLYSVGALLQGAEESAVLASDGLFSLLAAVGAAPHIWRIVVMLALMAVSLFALYALFHGFIWVHVFKILKVKTESTTIFKRFAQVSVLWAGVFFLQRIIFFVASFFVMLHTKDPAALNNDPVLVSMLFVIAYFAMVCATQIAEHGAAASIRRSFSLGIRRAPRILAAVILLVAVFLAVNYALFALQTLWPALLLIGGTIIVIPAMTWTRAFFTAWVRRIKA